MAKTVQIQGIPASVGVAVGEARLVYSWDALIHEAPIAEDAVTAEQERFERAVEKTIAELKRIRVSAGKTAGGPVIKIFDAQLMIAGDQEFIKAVKENIARRQVNAEAVYSSMVDESTATLRRSKDSYMRQMLVDIEAVSKKTLAYLTGDGGEKTYPLPPNTIIVAKRLTPAETLRFHERGAVAVICAEGSPHSHMALIARAIYMPAVVNVDRIQNRLRNGMRVVVDGGRGEVIIEPDEGTWRSFKKRAGRGGLTLISKLAELDRFPPVTTDGHEVQLAANIELPGPHDRALAARGVGVGLYRTEFIYLQSNRFPDENDQFEYYDAIAAQYAPQEVVMRTFDLGSDKYAEEFQTLNESNPALGWRGIRTSLDMPKMFKTQLRAILRSSARGNVKILLPMVSSLDEVIRAEKVIKRVKAELRREGKPFDSDIEVGVMIEVPSAALMSRGFAERSCFLSIGSNDLIQYTLAVDRDNNRLSGLYRKFHPAVLRLMKQTFDDARLFKRPVYVCGEMAGDDVAAPLLIGMGATKLSMNPTRLYRTARMISAMSYQEMREMADETLSADTFEDSERVVYEFHEKIKSRLTGVFDERSG